MRIYVDADACPVKKIIEDVAKKYGIPVTMVIDVNHILNSNYSEIITVSQGADSVDLALINRVQKGDIVVSQDYGVAALSLGKGAYAIGNSGLLYTKDNIDKLLFERFMHGKVRRAGKMGRGHNIKKRTTCDDDNFLYQFDKLCKSVINLVSGGHKMKTALVIMAAGIGSRFGGGIKQLAPVGPNGEIIMDYSIHDALEAGFNKVVFIIRRDLEKDFKEIIGNRIEKICEVEYAFQELSDLPEGFSVPQGRAKPWGTGQAILCSKNVVNEPFVIINADDYYGKEAFKKVHDYLVNAPKTDVLNWCMAGFILKNTLSENGGVSRGVCVADSDGNLKDIKETHNIVIKDGAAIDNGDGTFTQIDENSHVSMNMWGVTPEIYDILEKGFKEFLEGLTEADIKKEYLLPDICDMLIKTGKAQIKLLETGDKWFGVTYAEDKQYVMDSFKKLIEDGVYSEKLFA